MNAPVIIALPEGFRGLAVARLTIDHDGETPEQIAAAADVLSYSVAPADIARVRSARHALNAMPGAELNGLALSIHRRINEPAQPQTRDFTEAELAEIRAIAPAGLGRNADHFAKLRQPVTKAQKAQKARLIFGLIVGAFLVATMAHVALAAPAKIARTMDLHGQIEGLR